LPFTRTTKPEVALQESSNSPSNNQDAQIHVKLGRTPAVATIAGTATAVPPHLLTREVVKQCIGDVFSLDGMRLEAIRNVIDNSHIDQRHSVFPVEYVVEPRPLSQINVEYRQKAIELGMEATASALARAEMSPSDVDLLITVSCTGVMIPSLDAYIATEMGFRSDIRRLPITELGCAAGAAGLGRAWEYLSAFPDRTAMLVAVELPTLTFQRKDFSQANLISAVLFGDGAAGVVVTGREAPGPRIVASESFLFPNSLDAMGFDLRDSGFHIVLSKDVPQLIRERVRGLADGFLARQGLTRNDLSAFLLHPGGQKLLSFMESELGLTSTDTEISWDVLRRFGNLSSASVLFILHETMARREMPPESYGLLMAFGPGFTAEMILLQWP
jgi:alkylresorcinol/alkylpyrone synthase